MCEMSEDVWCHKFCSPIWNWISEFMGKLICQLCEFMEYLGPGRIHK